MNNLPINLHEFLNVFATLKVNLPVDGSPCLVPSLGKHLGLLNGIALLLVTEASSDAAAVTMTNNPAAGKIKTIFHLVKNRVYNKGEESYYAKFMAIINELNSENMLTELANLVIENCRPKIMSRAIKIEQAVKDRRKNSIELEDPDESTREAIDRFRGWYLHESAKEKPWPEFLDHWLDNSIKPYMFAQSSELPNDLRILWEVYEFTRSDKLLKTVYCTRLNWEDA